MTAGGNLLRTVSAEVLTSAGDVAARIDLVRIGGGVQVKTVDGEPVDHVHELREAFHVRMLSPDGAIPDELREAPDWDAAVKLALSYAQRRDEHAAAVTELAGKLAVG